MGAGHVEAMKFRRQVTAKLGKSGKRAEAQHAAAIAALQGMLADAGQPRVILSDENLLGSPERLEADRALYLDPGRKLAPLADALRPHRVTVFIGGSQPGRVHQFGPAGMFSDRPVRAGTARHLRPGLAVAQARMGGCGGGRGRALPAGVGGGVEPLASVSSNGRGSARDMRNRRSACARHVRRTPAPQPVARGPWRRCCAAPIRSIPPARMKALAAAMAAHPRTPDNPVFSLWGEGEAAVWQARFREDLARIRQMGPQVRLLEWNA